MNNMKTNSPKVKRETKNKIKVDFERTDWLTRFRLKFLTGHAFTKGLTALFKFLLLVGVSFVILYPFYTKISTSFMGRDDFVDVTVKLIPKRPTLDIYKEVQEVAPGAESENIDGSVFEDEYNNATNEGDGTAPQDEPDRVPPADTNTTNNSNE